MLGRLTENRGISWQTVWGSGSDTVQENQAGVVINNSSAFEIVAFTSAVSLISDTIATLPVDCFIRRDGVRNPLRPKPFWVNQPDIDSTRSGHYGAALVSLLIDGNAFIRVFRDKATAEPSNLIVLDPSTVVVKRNAFGRKMFEITNEDKLLDSSEVLHIVDLLEPGAIRGMSRVNRLSDSLGVASALQQYAARFFGSGSTTSGIIEFPGPLLTREQSNSLSEAFDAGHKGFRKAHKTGVLSGGATYKPTTVPNDSAQFLESRRFAVEEIARLFNIPLSFMGIPGTQSYASVEQNAIQFVTHTLRPYIEKLEWAYSQLLPEGGFLKFNVDGLLRGDFNSRVTAYNSAITTGWLNIDAVRTLEDLPPVPDGLGQAYRVPLANVNLAAAYLVEEQEKVKMVKALIDAGFEPNAVLQSFGMNQIEHTGVPTVQVQNIAQMNPEDPKSMYGV